MQLFATEYTLDTLSYTVWKLYDLNITIAHLPDVFPFQLTTTSMAVVLPQLLLKWGPKRPVVVSLNVTEAPKIYFRQNQFEVTSPITIRLQVNNSKTLELDQALTMVVPVHLVINLEIKPSPKGDLTIYIKIKTLKMTVSDLVDVNVTGVTKL